MDNDGYENEILLSPRLMLMSPPNATASYTREDAADRFIFELDSELFSGGGSGGSVHRVLDLVSGRLIASKILRNDPGAHWELKMYTNIATRLPHNVVPELLGASEIESGRTISIFMELLEPLQAQSKGAWKKYARGMRRCVEALHSIGVAHGDIHIGNFLYDPKAADDGVRIIDFGLSFDYRELIEGIPRPPSPRGKRHPNLSFASVPLRNRDFCIDNIKLEDAIDTLSV